MNVTNTKHNTNAYLKPNNHVQRPSIRKKRVHNQYHNRLNHSSEQKGNWIPKQASKQRESYVKELPIASIKDIGTCSNEGQSQGKPYKGRGIKDVSQQLVFILTNFKRIQVEEQLQNMIMEQGSDKHKTSPAKALGPHLLQDPLLA